MRPTGEWQADSEELFRKINWRARPTVMAGIYLSYQRPPPKWENAPLWVKERDWREWLTRFMRESALCDPSLPPVSEAALSAWFKGLSEAQRQLSKVALLELAKAAFPQNRVARERIRKIGPQKKPGPRAK
jgi:hypothetical protein